MNTNTPDNIKDIELERIKRLPMLDTNLKEVSDLVTAFVHQLAALGQTELAGIFPVGHLQAEISVKLTRKD